MDKEEKQIRNTIAKHLTLYGGKIFGIGSLIKSILDAMPEESHNLCPMCSIQAEGEMDKVNREIAKRKILEFEKDADAKKFTMPVNYKMVIAQQLGWLDKEEK